MKFMYNCPWCGSPSDHSYLRLKDYFLSQEVFEIFQCDHCHLLFTVPRPASADLSNYYQSENYYSHQENKKGFIPRIYEFVKSFNSKHKVHLASDGLVPGSVLDIGCGVGDFLVSMQQKGWKVSGIEPSDSARSIAEKRLGLTLSTPLDYPSFPDRSFDLITLWHVLEHVEDLHFQLSEIQRLLKPNGRLVLALPNFESFDCQYYKQYWAAWDVPRHLSHFSVPFIRDNFTSLSLNLTDIQKLKWDAYYISYLSEKYKGHGLPLLRGFFVGLVSNLKAHRTGLASSMVYIFQKQ